jgi:hypothetical protein
MRHTTDHLDAGRAEAAYRSAKQRREDEEKSAWDLYLIAAFSVAAKCSDNSDEIAEKAAEIANSLLRQRRLEWD